MLDSSKRPDLARHALARKYTSELHANEIMLLAYYIAAINIETAYSGVTGSFDDYEPFDGIVLTDTFQLSEIDDSMDTVFFPRNNARADRQKALDIRVIVGNPPYPGAQDSQNDDNANLKYPTLDATIENTYADRSTATLKTSLYNSYLRAFRWASNRLSGAADGGVVGFVSNGGWLDDNSADGVRHTFAHDFHHIYVFNLRGNQRTSGEQRRREGGKIFGSGSRNGIAITLLVKQPGPVPKAGAEIHYRDIGDYLDRDAKLAIVDEATVRNVEWSTIVPNEHADWTRQRDPRYDDLVPLAGEAGAMFDLASNGFKTNRDTWVCDSSRTAVVDNVDRMIDFYNGQLMHSTATTPTRPAL